MAQGNLNFGTHLRGAAEAHHAMSEAPDRITSAVRSATRDVTQLLGHQVDTAIARITGKGVYWDVVRGYTDQPGGGRGTITTGPNRPHIIRPKPTNKRNVLSFKVDGRWISAKEIHHPGANPVDWSQGLEGFGSLAETFYNSEVGQAINGIGGGGRFG